MPCTQAASPEGTVGLQRNPPGVPEGQTMIVDFPRLFQILNLTGEEVDLIDEEEIRVRIATRLSLLAKLPPCVRSCVLIESIALGLIVTELLLQKEKGEPTCQAEVGSE